MSKNGQYEVFGSGILIATPVGVANPTPVPFAVLQDVGIEMSGALKTLHGQNQFPVAAGRGEIKMTGKAKFGRISGQIYNSLFFGATSTAGTTKLATMEGPTNIPTTPFTITATNGATFAEDMGVIDGLTGVPLDRVASAPTTGQYSVNTTTGVYTFAAADTGKSVYLNYTYTVAVVGSTMHLGNPLQGVQPVFSCILQRSNNGIGERYKIWSAIAGKLSMPTKMADFGINELDFECFADSAGRTISVYTDI
jgi:hypothetical protein